MKVRILDTWEMDLPEAGAEPWFVDWAERSPKQAGDHLEVSWKTFCAVAMELGPDTIRTVHEYFGGIGAHALMLDNLFEPIRHYINDYSSAAVEHMQRALSGTRAWPCRADSYDLSSAGKADLQVLDFGDLTVWKANQPKQAALLDLVFALEPKAVTITDIAARYLHLQKGAYEPFLGQGTCESYETYLEAFSRQLEDRYGYVLLEGNYTRWSCVMAFVPEGTHGEFKKHISTGRGLVLS